MSDVSSHARELWERVAKAHRDLLAARREFHLGAQEKMAVLRAVLAGQGGGSLAVDRQTALHYLLWDAGDELKKELFAELVELASTTHANTVPARRVLLAIEDRDWVLARIEATAAPLLAEGDGERHLRMAELYAELNTELLRRHLDRCRDHADPEVREVLDYFTPSE